MKVFNKDGKINFVDDNNVFVGFDYSENCCEYFGWFLTKQFPTGEDVRRLEEPSNIDPDGYQFDPNFFEQNLEGYDFDEGGAAIFKLVKGHDHLFLTLFNSHNGYYGHGFEVKHGGITVNSGCL
jgi:hypothetical protein